MTKQWIIALSIASGLMAQTAFGANAGDRLYGNMPADIETLNNPYQYSDQIVKAKGKKLYRKNCSICHGKRGDGRGPMGSSSDPEATSFLDLTYMTQYGDQHFFWAVREGSKGTSMPAFKTALDEDAIWKIIAYIRYLPKK